MSFFAKIEKWCNHLCNLTKISKTSIIDRGGNKVKNKYMIIVTGELAAGKTTYGKKIAKELQLPFFSKDTIKELLFDSFDYQDCNYEEKRKIGKSSYAILYHVAETLMMADKSFVLESNFVKESIPILKALLVKYDYVSITVRFQCALPVLHQRFLQREYSEERHKGLVSNGVFDNLETFKMNCEKAKEFQIDKEEIVVDTTDFSKVNVLGIVTDIQDYIKN